MDTVDQSKESGTITRIHSLDAYRGVLMLLGIVIHGAIPFLDHDVESLSGDVVSFSFWLVHLFRMPAFFMLSGFFAALLWQRYGGAGMLMNRFERIVLPFITFFFVLPAVVMYPVLLIERWDHYSDSPFIAAFDATIKHLTMREDLGHL